MSSPETATVVHSGLDELFAQMKNFEADDWPAFREAAERSYGGNLPPNFAQPDRGKAELILAVFPNDRVRPLRHSFASLQRNRGPSTFLDG
jgi:hypothetical protein